MTHEPDALLVIGSGQDIYREYILESLARHWRLLLLAVEPVPHWVRRYAEEVRPVSSTDPAAVVPAAVAAALRHPLGGVLTYDEMAVDGAAAVAQALGLPGNPPEVARRCRDKASMRRAWAEAGVPSADSVTVRTVDEAVAAAATVGYPAVLKPRELAGSVGVVRVEDAAGLRRRWADAAGSSHAKFGAADQLLVEEYLDGPEVSVEGVVVDGSWRPVAVTRKETGDLPYFEETGHVVSAVDPLPGNVHSAVLAAVEAAHDALGVRWAVTHAEVRITPSGPRMVEIGARLGGDLIPLLVQLATGVDLSYAAGRIATGLAPDLAPRHRRAAAVRFFYAPYDGRVRRLDDAIGPRPPWLDRLVWKVTPGAQLLLPPRGFLARLGFAVVVGPDAAECRRRLDAVESLLRIELEPLTPPASAT